MHLIILLIVGLGAALLVARALATPGAVLREEVSLPWALLAGIGIGVFGALVFLSTQTDLVPDDVEANLLPYVLIGVTAAIAVGVGFPDAPALSDTAVDGPDAGDLRPIGTGLPGDPGAPTYAPRTKEEVDKATSKQIRGSSLLLFGRLISLGTNLVVQVMIVRYLSKADYGVFSYALSLAMVAATVVTLGTDRAIGRFLPIYHERGRPDAVLGALFIVIGTIASLGIALIVLVFGLRDLLSASLSEPRAGALLVILIVLAPIQALDDVLMSGFAVFANPRAIFFRRYVLNPILRIAVVGILIFAHEDSEFLAVGYVVTGAVGVVIYGALFVRLLRRVGVIPRGGGRPKVTVPWREVLGFSIPLLSTDLIYIILNSTDVIILGAVWDAETVASYRVIQPAAALNLIVLQSFTLLFTPVASRLFARGDHEGVKDLYWQTAAWVAVASFPIFALTFSLAEPLTVALYQERYASSAVFLAIIAIGRYFDAALGFNGLTVRVFGNVRAVVVVNLIAAGVNLVLLLTLIPAFGALGAAVATMLSLFVFNTMKQYALYRVSGISMFDRRYLTVYATIVLATVALLFVQLVVDPPFVVGLGMVALSSFVVLTVGRSHLRLAETFPELAKVPLVRRFMG